MSSSTTIETAAAPTTAAQLLDGADIAKVLSSKGPVVKAVLLKATTKGDKTATVTPLTDNTQLQETTGDFSAPDGMEEIDLDTTPSKSMVAQILGGDFTFLGQYEDEGIVLMVRKWPFDLEEAVEEEFAQKPMSQLKEACRIRGISIEEMLEKSDLIQALQAWLESLPPVNPHSLQPPLNHAKVRGDILVVKVAETREELDQLPSEGDNDAPSDAVVQVLTNDEFFLNYSLEEFLAFASRTDIAEYKVDEMKVNVAAAAEEKPSAEEDGEAAQEESDRDDEEGGADDDDDNDDDGPPFRLGEDEELDEEDKSAMFNLVMNEVLRQYREEHGRGPNTQELLELRATIAKELDVQVAHIDAEQADWNRNAKDGTPAKETVKKIGFSSEDKVLTYEPDPNEHSHHNDPFDDDDDDDDDYYGVYDDEQNQDDSNDQQDQPPRKRLKTGQFESVTNGEEDSKPAAIDKSSLSPATSTSTPNNAEATVDQTTTGVAIGAYGEKKI